MIQLTFNGSLTGKSLTSLHLSCPHALKKCANGSQATHTNPQGQQIIFASLSSYSTSS